MSVSQASSCSVLRQFTVGKLPITPLRQAATMSSTPDTRNIGAAISGRLRRSRKNCSRSDVTQISASRLPPSAGFVVPSRIPCASVARNIGTTQADDKATRKHMSDPLHASSPTCAQALRALARYPGRTAFAWPGGSLSYQGTHRPDRTHPGRVHAARLAARRARRLPHRQPRRHLVRRRRRAIVARLASPGCIRWDR